MSKSLFSFLLILIFLSACGKRGIIYSGLQIKNKPIDIAAKIPEVKQVEEEEKVELIPYPATIRNNLYDVPELVLPDPFNSYQAMFKLFPGRYFKSDGGVSLSWWTAPNTPKQKFPDWANPWHPEEWPQRFPWADSQTEHLGTCRYVNAKGEECVVLNMQSTEFGYGDIKSGRTTGAILGMALFIKEDGNWVLKNFNPAIGCYGSFQSTPEPIIARTEKGEVAFYFESDNGGAGGPRLGNTFVIVPTDSSFREVCTIRSSSREWHACCWNTDLKFESNGDPFPKIIATNEGVIDGEDGMMGWDFVPPEVLKYARHHYKFKFKEVKEYIYTNDKYQLTSTNTYVWNKGWKLIE